MTNIEPERLLRIYRQDIRNLEEPDELCTEVFSLLVTRDLFEKVQLSSDQQRRLAELDDQLIDHWETLAACLPSPTPRERQHWWWFLHEGPQVRLSSSS